MRADLLALTPEAVAALSNAGLVKRALRELEQGQRPQLEETADGTVVARFADGATARLEPGKVLRDTPCSCNASGVCRHRVAAALAYPAFARAGEPGDTSAAARESPAVPWSPGSFDDAALERALARRILEQAQALRRRGLVVEIRRSSAEDPVPAAALPACSVRFLVPGDLAYARCDCELGQRCAHVAVAVWAFREADARGTGTIAATVVLGEGAHVEATPAGSAALAALTALTTDLLLDGAVHVTASAAQRFALVRSQLIEAGLTWQVTLLDDVEAMLSAYRQRSARYREAELARLLNEVHARALAAQSDGELPRGHVLGQGEAAQTRLDHLRLLSLGARVTADGTARDVEVFLADPDTATVLVLHKRFETAEGEAPADAVALGGRRVASQVALGSLARGQLVTRVARRRANRTLVLGAPTGGQTSLTAQAGDWGQLPAPLLVGDLAALAQRWRERPPRALRPRVLAEDIHVVQVNAVQHVAFDPAEQMLAALVSDAAGNDFVVARRYRAVAPGALEAIAQAFSGELGAVAFVAGELRRHLSGFELDPTAISVGGRLVVPDLEAPQARAMPRGQTATASSPLEDGLAAAMSTLHDAAHIGLQRVGASWFERLREAAAALSSTGLRSCAAALRGLEAAATRAQVDAAGKEAAARAWQEAALRLHVAAELT